MFRGLVLVVLCLGVAGFGLCSLCGGVMGVSFLLGSSAKDRGQAPVAFFFFVGAGLIAALCFWGFRKLGRNPKRGSADAGEASPPPASP